MDELSCDKYAHLFRPLAFGDADNIEDFGEDNVVGIVEDEPQEDAEPVHVDDEAEATGDILDQEYGTKLAELARIYNAEYEKGNRRFVRSFRNYHRRIESQSPSQPPASPSPSATDNAILNTILPGSLDTLLELGASEPSTNVNVTPSVSTSTGSRLTWTSQMDRALLNFLADSTRRGLQTNGANFKGPVWNGCASDVCKTTEQSVNGQQCCNRYRNYFRLIWKDWERHVSATSGWTFDHEKGTLVNSPQVMDDYFATHTEMRKFRDEGPPFKDLLQEILGGQLATGEFGASGPSGARTSRRRGSEEDEVSNDQRRDERQAKRARKERGELGIQSHAQELLSSSNSIADALKSSRERAVYLFLDEVDSLVPEQFKVNGNGEVTYPALKRFLAVFNSTKNCDNYLALRKKSSSLRLNWLLMEAGLNV